MRDLALRKFARGKADGFKGLRNFVRLVRLCDFPHINLTCVKKKVESAEKKSFSLRIRKMGGFWWHSRTMWLKALRHSGFAMCDFGANSKMKVARSHQKENRDEFKTIPARLHFNH